MQEDANKLAEVPELGEQKDDEVTTRRKQFRMKADKRLKKQEKKQQKKIEKAEKKTLKETKKAEKEQRKKKKEMDKQELKAEKQAKRQQKKRKAKASEAEDMKPEQSTPNEHDEGDKSPQENTPEPNLSQQGHDDKGAPATADTDLDSGDSQVNAVDIPLDDGVPFEDAGPIEVPNNAVKRSSPRRGSKQWKLKILKADQLPSACSCPNHKRKAEESQGKPVQDEAEKGKQIKKNHKPRKATKQTVETKAKLVAKPKQSKSKSKGTPRPDAVGLIQGVLTACENSECSHPEWKQLDFDKKVYSVSVYWTRMAVGIKIAKAIVDKLVEKRKNKKAGKTSKLSKKAQAKQKGKGKWSQVAYFACPTNCFYSNIALAYEYASWYIWYVWFFLLFCSCTYIYLECVYTSHASHLGKSFAVADLAWPIRSRDEGIAGGSQSLARACLELASSCKVMPFPCV